MNKSELYHSRIIPWAVKKCSGVTLALDCREKPAGQCDEVGSG